MSFIRRLTLDEVIWLSRRRVNRRNVCSFQCEPATILYIWTQIKVDPRWKLISFQDNPYKIHFGITGLKSPVKIIIFSDPNYNNICSSNYQQKKYFFTKGNHFTDFRKNILYIITRTVSLYRSNKKWFPI